MAAIAADAATRERDNTRGERGRDNCINSVAAGSQDFRAGLVSSRIADDNPAVVENWRRSK